MKLFPVILIFILYSCSSEHKNSEKSLKINRLEEVKTPYFKKVRLKSFESEKGFYSFNLKNDTTLAVLVGGQEMQELKTSNKVSLNDFYLSDWNFDGYDDLFIVLNQGNVSCTYQIWNYNPSSGKFQLNNELTDIMGVEKDDRKKQIIFHYREGWQSENWRKYKYKDDSLVFIDELRIERWTDKNKKNWVKKTTIKRVRNSDIVCMDSLIVTDN
jgi:hypothetical protein